jgi:hypothetical protein
MLLLQCARSWLTKNAQRNLKRFRLVSNGIEFASQDWDFGEREFIHHDDFEVWFMVS